VDEVHRGGEGDARRAELFTNSYGRDAEFAGFYRSMQAYKNTLGKDDTTIVLSPDSGFLKDLNQ
jgi:membrane protease subunit HflC